MLSASKAIKENRKRYTFDFRNGTYDARKGTFEPLADPNADVAHRNNTVLSQHDFQNHAGDYKTIPTPNFDSLLGGD